MPPHWFRPLNPAPHPTEAGREGRDEVQEQAWKPQVRGHRVRRTAGSRGDPAARRRRSRPGRRLADREERLGLADVALGARGAEELEREPELLVGLSRRCPATISSSAARRRVTAASACAPMSVVNVGGARPASPPASACGPLSHRVRSRTARLAARSSSPRPSPSRTCRELDDPRARGRGWVLAPSRERARRPRRRASDSLPAS